MNGVRPTGSGQKHCDVRLDDALAGVADSLPKLLPRDDPQLAARKHVDEHGLTGHVAAGLELAGMR